MKIYQIETFEYNTYSYSGILPRESFYFTTKEGAIRAANRMKLTIVGYCKDPEKECELNEIDVKEDTPE